MKKNIIPNKDPKTIILSSKLLTVKTDLKHQLILPTQFVKLPPICEELVRQSITCFDSYGHQWIFPLALRKGRHPKPTIPPAPWRKFVKEYGLRGGDAVVFYTRVDDPKNRIHIRGMRKSLLPFKHDEDWVEVRKEAHKPARIGSP